jgi:hypothetical protein
MDRSAFLAPLIGEPWAWQSRNCWDFACHVQRNSFADVSTVAIRLLASQSTQGSYKFGALATRKLPVWNGEAFVTRQPGILAGRSLSPSCYCLAKESGPHV